MPEAARYLDVPASTLTTWLHGYHRRSNDCPEVVGEPVLTALPRSGVRSPVIPSIGLAEGVVLTATRRSGAPLQRIRPALEQLDSQFGLDHALASRRLTVSPARPTRPAGTRRARSPAARTRVLPMSRSTATAWRAD